MASGWLNPRGPKRAAKQAAGSPEQAAEPRRQAKQDRELTVGERVQRFALPWYRPEDWNQLVAAFDDAETLPRHYEDWLSSAEMVVHLLREQGVRAEKVYIDPATFPKWCASHGLRPNARARMRFAGEAATRKKRCDA